MQIHVFITKREFNNEISQKFSYLGGGGGGVLVLGDKSFFDIFIEIYRVIEDVYGTFEHIVIDPFLYV